MPSCRPPWPIECAGDFIHLAVLAPSWASWPAGRGSIGAVALAVEAINADANGNSAGGKKVVYAWEEVDCNPSQALATLSRMLEQEPIDAVIGPVCDLACESTAYLTGGRGVPHISYHCTSGALSNKATFPTVRLAYDPLSFARC
jgi:ABC-type branched-subunit amino acid transport system substrate-binding protein